MQAAIMGYCLKNALPENEQTMENILRLASKEEIENVEIYAGQWQFEGDIRKASESLRRVANSTGVNLPVYGSGTRIGHIGPQRQICMDKLKQEVEACAILGGKALTFPVIDGQPVPPDRPNATFGIRFELMLPALVEQAQELSDYAAQYDVELAVLNHCFLVYLGWHQKWIVRLVERSNFGACVDPGNYLHYGCQEPVEVCKELACMTKMVRAGDVEPAPEAEVISEFKKTGQFHLWRATRFGEGVINQAACYKHLAEGGYDGFVSLKTAGSSPEGPLAAIRQSWKALNNLLQRIG
jgi:sugar phosphate isomerase/epimerase